MKRTALALVLSLPILSAAAAQNPPRGMNWKSAWTAGNELSLAMADTAQESCFPAPAIQREPGHRVCLRFQAYIAYPQPGGWNNFLSVALNGTRLGAKMPDREPRLVNRRLVIETRHPNYPIVSMIEPRDGVPCLNVFFGPKGQPLDPIVLTDRQEGYWYILDVSDLIRSDVPNRLCFTNLALARIWQGHPPAGMALRVDSISLGQVPETEIAAITEGQLTRRPVLPAAARVGDGVSICPGGGLLVQVAGENYFVESAFSFPRDPAKGWNRLSCEKFAVGEPNWKPVATASDNAVTLQADGAGYSLKRQIRKRASRIEVTDAVTNRGRTVLGLAVEHTLITGQRISRCLLNGLEDAGHSPGTSPEHPTAFAAQNTSGIGIVLEDDALRLQHWTRQDGNVVNLGTDWLGLAPGETYVMRWALYPGSTDYFSFINQLRRDWNVNFRIDGPWDFFDARRLRTREGQNEARSLLARKHLKIFALSPWFEYYSGWPYTRPEYKTLITDARQFLKSLDPEAKCIACIETNLVPVELSLFKQTIPAQGWPIGREIGGQYGQIATPQMTACVDATAWRDSCQRDARGQLLLDCWYVQYYKSRPALNLMVYPESSPSGTPPDRLSPYANGMTPFANHRHQQMLEQIAWLLDDVGLDGVYIDQFSLAFNTGLVRWTQERWDGRTVKLDPNGRVAQKLADTGLISASARKEWVESVLKRGKIVVANSNAALGALQTLPAFRFMETQGYEPLVGNAPYQPTLAKGQLGSPIGLGHSFPSSAGADFFIRTVIAHLRFGMLYYYYATEFPADGPRGGEFGPVNHMFPFTPVELHEGWVLGQQRLITAISGTFEWPHARQPRVLLFDSRGREKPSEARIAPAGTGFRVTIRLRDWREIAVLE